MFVRADDGSVATLVIKKVAALLPTRPRSKFSACCKIAKVTCVKLEQIQLRRQFELAEQCAFSEGVCEVGVLELSGLLFRLTGRLRRTNLFVLCHQSSRDTSFSLLNETSSVTCFFFALPIITFLAALQEGRYVRFDYEDLAWTRCCYESERQFVELLAQNKMYLQLTAPVDGPVAMRIAGRDLRALGISSKTQYQLVMHIQASSVTSYLLSWQDPEEYRACFERLLEEIRFYSHYGWCYWLADTVGGSCHQWTKERSCQLHRHDIPRSVLTWVAQLPYPALEILASVLPLCEPLPPHFVAPPTYTFSLPLLSPWALIIRSNLCCSSTGSEIDHEAIRLFGTYLECLHHCTRDQAMFIEHVQCRIVNRRPCPRLG